MTRLLSKTFRSIKLPYNKIPELNPKPRPPHHHQQLPLPPTPSSSSSSSKSSTTRKRGWSVYLILSTNFPIKTYVGVTTNFPRRLKQHNGKLKGGAKASRAGRPWVCACVICGFKDKSEAFKLESKWKIFSRKLPRKSKNNEMAKQVDDGSLPLLQHRYAALNGVKGSIDFSHLEIDWKLNPF